MASRFNKISYINPLSSQAVARHWLKFDSTTGKFVRCKKFTRTPDGEKVPYATHAVYMLESLLISVSDKDKYKGLIPRWYPLFYADETGEASQKYTSTEFGKRIPTGNSPTHEWFCRRPVLVKLSIDDAEPIWPTAIHMDALKSVAKAIKEIEAKIAQHEPLPKYQLSTEIPQGVTLDVAVQKVLELVGDE